MSFAEEVNYVILGTGGHAQTLRALIGQGKLIPSEETPPEDATLFNGRGNAPSLAKGPDLRARYELYEKYERNMTGYLDATAKVLGQRQISSQIFPFAYVGYRATVMHNVIINTRATVEHNCFVGTGCHIAPGAILCGNVEVGMFSHVGAGAVVRQNIVIGRNVLIGAGSIVTKDIPHDGIWLGDRLWKASH